MAGVGTRKVFENDCIIVWEFELEPGEKTPVHTHEHDYIFYVIDGTTLEVFDADDRPLGDLVVKSGDVIALRCEGGELISTDGKGHRVPATHSARNGGTTRYREVLVETK